MAVIEKNDVADLLARSNALTPTEGTNVPVGQKPSITPENAVKLMDEHEAKNRLESGEQQKEVVEKLEPIPATDGMPDLTGKTLDEQIAILNEYKEKQELIKNPMKTVEDRAEKAGVNISTYREEYIRTGKLSEESLKALDKAGFDKVAVDAYIDSKNMQAETLATNAITSITGSKENFTEMSKWMLETLTPTELAKYNAGVQTENYEVHLENMWLKYTRAIGEVKPEARTLRGNGETIRNSGDSAGFKNQGEMVLAMKDPRYNRDAVYRREVQRKVALMQ